MEKKGFVTTLGIIEADGITVEIISTDRQPQIKKDMRVNHADIDPWHLAKSVSKKLSAASKKLVAQTWHHGFHQSSTMWWCAESCNKDAKILQERWLSVIHHVTNRHSWPGNKHFHQCDHHQPHSREQQRKKKWLKPGSAAHTALVNIVKDKLLLKDLLHLTQFAHTTALEVYHSMYPKYLPKLQHFTHDVMKVGAILAALEHNFNANRPQVSGLMVDLL